jgi:hypothetical protein
MGIAKIENGEVVHIDRTTDVAPEGWLVVGPEIVCGMLWDGEQFTAPPPLPPPAPSWPSLDFMELFTDAEQLAIVTATLANPAVKLWYDKAMAAGTVRADDPRTVAGMAALVTAGLLTEQRKTEILGG